MSPALYKEAEHDESPDECPLKCVDPTRAHRDRGDNAYLTVSEGVALQLGEDELE